MQDPLNANPFSVPVESPFRRSSSTPIDSCQNSPLDEHPSGIARTTSAGSLQDHARSRRDKSAVKHPGHHQQGLPPYTASASCESSRCIIPSGVSSNIQHHSVTTTTLNDVANTRKWVSYAASHYPRRAASHNPERASVKSTFSVEYSKKLQLKRQDDTSKRSSSGATKHPQQSPPRSPALSAVPHKHISSGVAFYSRIVAQQQEKLVAK